MQRAIAWCISHTFGIGGSRVHDEAYEGFTDSVTFGAWKSEVFDRIGPFDERLVRNQDDEFHYRANAHGLKVYQDPAIKLYYSPRSTLKSLFIQYFEYGLFKPMVLRKVTSGLRIRHLVPALFCLYLLSLIPALAAGLHFWFIPLGVYALFLVVFSLFNSQPWAVRVRALAAFPTLHVAYGSGFMLGLFRTGK
jgi:GT2 family glycosyltransferase